MTEFERMVEFLDRAWICKDQIVPCLIGPVGIGKTAAVRQHAENVGANNVVTIIASQILPSEVSGITMPDQKTKSMEIYDHYRLSSLKDGDILFFDELLEADQCVLSACLTLIESRMMMSGKILPDIQIIAATNPTVEALAIKENIRQRFMFMEFKIDEGSTRKYIKEKVGFDPGDMIARRLESTSKEFNILSPRSLTKLCEWISKAGPKDARKIGDIIDGLYHSSIGSTLAGAYLTAIDGPEQQARRKANEAVRSVLNNEGLDKIIEFAGEKNRQAVAAGEAPKYSSDRFDENQIVDMVFEDTSMDELMDLLTSLPDWDKVAAKLAEAEIEEHSDSGDDIKF